MSPNKEQEAAILTEEQIQEAKELSRLIYEKQNFGKHHKQRGTKGAFGKNKPLYKPQSKWN